MSGIFHKFYISDESDINKLIENKISYRVFSETHKKTYIDDNLIQILLSSKYFIDVPSYDYKNQTLETGIDTTGATVFRNTQVPFLLDKLCIFENEIEKVKDKILYYGSSKEEILGEVKKLKDLSKCAIENRLCIYHRGL